jgi:hypothetical protein
MKSTIGGAVPQYLLNRPEISEKELEGKTDEELEMIKLMGFTGFDSTKVFIFLLIINQNIILISFN